MPVLTTATASAATLAIIAATGGGIALTAESSVPGDLLYPVKIHVNESVRGGLAFSSEADAKVEADRSERRLEEAEKLAVEGKLNAEQRAKLQQAFNVHADLAQSFAARASEEGRAQASALVMADLAEKFEVRAEAFERLSAEKEEAKEDLLAIVADIRAQRKEVMAFLAQIDTSLGADIRAVIEASEQSRQAFSAASSSVTAETHVESTTSADGDSESNSVKVNVNASTHVESNVRVVNGVEQ